MHNSYKVILITTTLLAILWALNDDSTLENSDVNTASTDLSKIAKNAGSGVQIDPFAAIESVDAADPASSIESDEESNPESEQHLTACNTRCNAAIDFIQLHAEWSELSDTEYESALSYADDLATHLSVNPSLRTELIAIALHAPGGTREIIINAFMQLDHEQQRELGSALLDSTFRNQRHDGVNLLATSTNMNKSVAWQFSDLLATEQDNHIRKAMVRALDQTTSFENDQDILDILSLVRATDSDESVRGAALLASARLNANSDELLTSAIAAIRSNTHVSQKFGVQSLQVIINRKTQNELQANWQDNLEAQQLASDLMTPAFDDLPEVLRRTLDDLTDNFF